MYWNFTLPPKEEYIKSKKKSNVVLMIYFQDRFMRGIYTRKNACVSLNTKIDNYQTSTYNMRREMLDGSLALLMSDVITKTFFNFHF